MRKSVLIYALIGVSTLLAIGVVSYNVSFSQLQDKGGVLHALHLCSGLDGVTYPTGHWNKVVFKIVDDPSGKIPKKHLNTLLEVVYSIDPTSVVNVKEMVREVMIRQYGMYPGSGKVFSPPENRIDLTEDDVQKLEIKIVDVEYAMVCPNMPESLLSETFPDHP